MALSQKTKYIFISLSILLITCLATVATLFILNKNNANINSKNSNTTKVKSLVDQADQARLSNDTSKAKTLLTKAKEQVDQLPTSDDNTSAEVDINAQLYLLDHSGSGN